VDSFFSVYLPWRGLVQIILIQKERAIEEIVPTLVPEARKEHTRLGAACM